MTGASTIRRFRTRGRSAMAFLAIAMIVAVTGVRAEDTAPVSERPIYESIDGIRIGRVFLSPTERQRLDAVRHLEPGPTGPAVSSEAMAEAAAPEPPRGNGFIQVTGKAPRVFKDGDFVRAAASSAGVDATPPGVFIRHETPPPDADGTEE